MIEKIYKNKYMATCDNCGTGQECDSWAEVIDFMNEEGWKKRLVDGEWKHYCPECREVDDDQVVELLVKKHRVKAAAEERVEIEIREASKDA